MCSAIPPMMQGQGRSKISYYIVFIVIADCLKRGMGKEYKLPPGIREKFPPLMWWLYGQRNEQNFGD